MATLMQDLPRELHMSIMRCTPHPRAALVKEFYRSDAWEDMLERRNFARWEWSYHCDKLSYDRAKRKLSRDPIEALAADRRTALRILSVYADTDDESLWSRKRARTGCW